MFTSQATNVTDRSTGTDVPKRSSQAGSRFMLWIDAVGGYLVCLADEIIVGPAIPGGTADVAIQADLSRKHAKIARVSGGYIAEPLHGNIAVNGRVAREAVLLSDGDELLLGSALKMRFRKPHVLSSSARLEIISDHRSQPHADAVILMAESCVLGAQWQNHIVCRDWSSDVVLYRHAGQLFCRAAGTVKIDGKTHERSGRLQPGSHVVGPDFSLSLEAV